MSQSCFSCSPPPPPVAPQQVTPRKRTRLEEREEQRQIRARNLRYKRPALASMGYDDIHANLEEISRLVDDLRWCIEGNETLDFEDQEECTVLCTGLSYRLDELYEQMGQVDWQVYDDLTVALLGDRYKLIGYDTYEEDYYHLLSIDETFARDEAGQRFMRLTKKEMMSSFRQVLGLLVSFFDLRDQFTRLQASIGVLQDDRSALLDAVREIEQAYEDAARCDFDKWDKRTERLDQLISAMPQRVWVEG